MKLLLTRSVVCLTGFCLGTMLLGGCKGSWQDPPSAIEKPDHGVMIDLPALETLRVVKQTVTSPPFNLPVQQEQGGTIVTGYQPFPGQWHIVRRWQERTRYRIDVMPDFERPDARSKLEVWEETETRAANNQSWDRDASLKYPDRARKLLEQIQSAARSSSSSSGATTLRADRR